MKRYRLLKEIVDPRWGYPKGSVFTKTGMGGNGAYTCGNFALHPTAVENNSEWFEPIPDEPEQTTKPFTRTLEQAQERLSIVKEQEKEFNKEVSNNNKQIKQLVIKNKKLRKNISSHMKYMNQLEDEILLKQPKQKDKEWMLNFAKEAYRQSQSNTPKEEQPHAQDKDWEILKEDYDGESTHKKILQVKRLSDGVVFSVGEGIYLEWGNEYKKSVAPKIKGFEVEPYLGMKVLFDSLPFVLLGNLKKLPSTNPSEQPKERIYTQEQLDKAIEDAFCAARERKYIKDPSIRTISDFAHDFQYKTFEDYLSSIKKTINQ